MAKVYWGEELRWVHMALKTPQVGHFLCVSISSYPPPKARAQGYCFDKHPGNLKLETQPSTSDGYVKTPFALLTFSFLSTLLYSL